MTPVIVLGTESDIAQPDKYSNADNNIRLFQKRSLEKSLEKLILLLLKIICWICVLEKWKETPVKSNHKLL